MVNARTYVEKFSELFKGNEDVYGVHVPEKPKPGEKAVGKSFSKRAKLDVKGYMKHLLGNESIGVVPLDASGAVNFSVIDVDEYPLEPTNIMAAIKRAKLPLMGFRSKSGGLHLYCFFRVSSAASQVLPITRTIRRALGLKPDTEIFPKQTKLLGDAVGSWINLPYFNFEKTVRYAYDENCQPMSLKEALAQAFASRTTIQELQGMIKELPLAQAPPCLQTLFLKGGAGEGARNAFLFNCATYLKARFGEGFSEHLHVLNRHMQIPLEYEELDRTIISSHNKGDYNYQCTDGTLMLHCDKEECGTRKFGKGVGLVSDLSFEQLTQIQCSKPYYRWKINGEEMIFQSEADLMNQNKFRELCLRYLHKVPERLKDNSWTSILNRALINVEVLNSDASDGMSEDSLWMSKVGEFLSLRRAVRASQIEDGLVYNNGNGCLHFKGNKLLEHLEKTNLFRNFKSSDHRHLLKKLGARQAKLRYTDIGKTARTWEVDLNSLHARNIFTEIEIDEEDYTKEMKPLDFIGEEKY